MSMKDTVVDLMPTWMVKFFAGPYVAGDSEEKAVEVARDLWQEKKLKSTIDLLGEEVTSSEEVDLTMESYEKLIRFLGEQEYATISIKPTQFGSHESMETCRENMRKITAESYEKNIPVTIDMEDHNYTDLTLQIYKELLPEFPGLGTVLQTRLHRTGDDIKNLKGLKTRIRLCIGIYLEPRSIALQRKSEMKKRLLEQSEILLDDGHYVEFATHDEKIIRRFLEMADRREFKKDQYEVQMLLGVPRRSLQQELIGEGIDVRLYVPYAVSWKLAMAYCKRRLAANPNIAYYGAKNILTGLRSSK